MPRIVKQHAALCRAGVVSPEKWGLPTNGAIEVPAFLLDGPDVAHGLHAIQVLHSDFGDPLHASSMAPETGLCGALQSASRDRAQAALRAVLIFLLHTPGVSKIQQLTCQEISGYYHIDSPSSVAAHTIGLSVQLR